MENNKEKEETVAPIADATQRSRAGEHPSGSKPVGYGSSIQSDGHGNRTRPQDKAAKQINDDEAKPAV